MKIFTVHDSKAEAYLPPFYMKTKGEALRAFETTVKDTNSQFNKYPHDYTLVELGNFDENSAAIVTHQAPLILANASEYIH
ncbi:nonstructural protein [Apis mellifera associated microvirus 29]|nr:nonstructural protein [Apis mellifera associated microvirus 29]